MAKLLAQGEKPQIVKIARASITDQFTAQMTGHQSVYIGSDPGTLFEALAQLEIRNPIFFFDEVDKLRPSDLNFFLELLEKRSINSRYFDFKIPLGKILIVFAANSIEPMKDNSAFFNRLRIVQIEDWEEDKKLSVLCQIIDEKIKTIDSIRKEKYEKIINIFKTILCDTLVQTSNESGIRQAKETMSMCIDKMLAKKKPTKDMQFTPDLLDVGFLPKKKSLQNQNQITQQEFIYKIMSKVEQSA